MDDAAFIIGLMKTETDALGFIPSTAIRERWIKLGRFIIATDRQGHRVGYLLHGPLKPGKPCHVNQVVLEYDRRRRRHATAAVDQLLGRANKANCSQILLRCAADLDACEFWRSLNFDTVSLSRGGFRRRRTVYSFSLPIFQRSVAQIRRCGRFEPHPPPH